MKISIIVCSHNRAAALENTLHAIDAVVVPSGCDAELVVVDNASTDNTSAIARQTRMEKMPVRCLFESRKGLSNARNTGIVQTRGEIVVFTDDDVAPAPNWLEQLAQPLLEGRCDGVAGGVRLAEHLRRPWMNQTHRNWLAAQNPAPHDTAQLVGANMGFHRSVLERVPGFDPELGAGALGYGEDTLFSMQMIEAGYRLRSASDAVVIHHLDASRLRRSAWLSAANKHGATSAYILHHWRHGVIDWPLVRFCYLGGKLLLRRQIQRPPPLHSEGCPAWELSYVADMAACRQFVRERRRPRNYAKHGLRKTVANGKTGHV